MSSDTAWSATDAPGPPAASTSTPLAVSISVVPAERSQVPPIEGVNYVPSSNLIPPTSAASSLLPPAALMQETMEQILVQQDVEQSIDRALDEILARYNVRINSSNMRSILRSLAAAHLLQPQVPLSWLLSVRLVCFTDPLIFLPPLPHAANHLRADTITPVRATDNSNRPQ